jgi:hypothetical protein
MYDGSSYGKPDINPNSPSPCYDYQPFITKGQVSIAGKTGKRYVCVLGDTRPATGDSVLQYLFD